MRVSEWRFSMRFAVWLCGSVALLLGGALLCVLEADLLRWYAVVTVPLTIFTALTLLMRLMLWLDGD